MTGQPQDRLTRLTWTRRNTRRPSAPPSLGHLRRERTHDECHRARRHRTGIDRWPVVPAGAGPARAQRPEVAARAGNSARVLYEVYLHCTDGQDDVVSQRIEDALDAGTGITHSPRCGTASGYTHRRLRPDPVRYMSVNLRRQPAPGPQSPARAEQDRSRRPPRSKSASAVQTASCGSLCGSREQPALAHA